MDGSAGVSRRWRMVTLMVMLIVTLLSFAYIFTWELAVMLLVIICVHEAGHIWAMRRLGVGKGEIYFIPIPFIGAITITDKLGGDFERSYVSIMGPVWGLFLGLLAVFVYCISKNPIWGAFARLSCLINLYNLMPIYPLDGGRIMRCIKSPSVIAGFLVVGVLAVMGGFYIFGMVAILASLRSILDYRKYKQYSASLETMWPIISLLYFGLICEFIGIAGLMDYAPGVASIWKALILKR